MTNDRQIEALRREVSSLNNKVIKVLSILAPAGEQQGMVTGKYATKVTGVTAHQLEAFRKAGSIRFEKAATGGYRYDLESIKKLMA